MIELLFRRLRLWGILGMRVVSATILLSSPALANQGAGGTGSILNILLLGVVAYFLVRAFRRRSGRDDKTRPDNRPQDRPEDSPSGETPSDRTVDRHDVARQMWEMLGSQPQEPVDSPLVQDVSGGFDEAEFLEGAKVFFSRFQQIDDRSDLDALHGFLSESVYSEVLGRLQSGGGERAEVMLLDARIVETKTQGGRTSVSVHYDAQLRKGASGERAEQVRSVWEFSRDDGTENGLWTLEKINTMTQ